MSSDMYWAKLGYTPILYVDVVSQLNVNNVLGSLKNVSIADSSITENYNSDTRVQAKVVTVSRNGESDGYIENGRLRMILSIPTRDWTATLFTGFVTDMNESDNDGYIKRTYTLESTIWGLTDQYMHIYVTISKGARVKVIMEDLLKQHTTFQYDLSNAKDRTFGDTKVYDVGTSLLNIFMEINDGYNRLEVDPFGKFLLKEYKKPKNQTASKTIDYADVNTLTMDELTKSTNATDCPGRTIVISRGGDKLVSSHYDPSESAASSQKTRGWLKVKTAQYNGSAKDPGISELHSQAQKLWEDNQDKGIEWGVKTYFANYHAGEVVNLIPRKQSSRKCLISNVDTSFGDMTQKLTCKEL